MPIPGLRLLDDIIAGLPTNSQQRLAIAELKAQIEVLERENRELKLQAQAQQPKGEIAVEAGKILLQLFQADAAFSAEQMAQGHGLQASVAKYHCDRLLKLGLIKHADTVVLHGQPYRYMISDKGRAWVIERGMG